MNYVWSKFKLTEINLSLSKYVTYRSQLNSQLSVHPVYTCEKYIPDYKRQAITRLRLMSHNLKIETGRRNGTPIELRLCVCGRGDVQDEAHVLLQCVLSRRCRARYQMLDFSSVNTLMGSDEKTVALCNYVNDVLEIYS